MVLLLYRNVTKDYQQADIVFLHQLANGPQRLEAIGVTRMISQVQVTRY
jgi:hypothetical protein